MSRDSIRRAIRTFVITTLGLFIPGLLGWLNDLTSWARGQGSTPFPDAHGLAYLGVSAIVAGVVAIINLLWNTVEDASGKGLLRVVPPKSNEAGAVDLGFVVVLVLVVIIVLVLLGVAR